MLFTILNLAIPIFLVSAAIFFVASNLIFLRKSNKELKTELKAHAVETHEKYTHLESDINRIKNEIHDIPKHAEMAALIRVVREKDAQVSKILVELPERLKHHNLQSANQISEHLKLAFQALLHDELQNYNLVKIKK